MQGEKRASMSGLSPPARQEASLLRMKQCCYCYIIFRYSIGTPEKFHSKIVLHHSGKIKSKCGNRIAPQLRIAACFPLCSRAFPAKDTPSCSNTGSFREFFFQLQQYKKKISFHPLICLISQLLCLLRSADILSDYFWIFYFNSNQKSF